MPGHPVIRMVAGPVGSCLHNTVSNSNCGRGGSGGECGFAIEKSWGISCD